MVDEITYEDIHQQYVGGVVKFKGKPVYVLEVGRDKMITFLDMKTQKRAQAPFSFEDFTLPTYRLGMVNHAKGVAYLTRRPVRKMVTAISLHNIVAEAISKGASYANNRQAVQTVQEMKHKCVYNTIVGDYPPFAACLAFVRANENSAMAFDRQFAIDSEMNVYYKTAVVGKLPSNANNVEKIEWTAGNEYLEFLIGDKCEKSLRVAG